MLIICFKIQRCSSALEAVGELPSSSQVRLTSFVSSASLFWFLILMFCFHLSHLSQTSWDAADGSLTSFFPLEFKWNSDVWTSHWRFASRCQCFLFTAPPLTSPHLSVVCSVISQECGLMNNSFAFLGHCFELWMPLNLPQTKNAYLGFNTEPNASSQLFPFYIKWRVDLFWSWFFSWEHKDIWTKLFCFQCCKSKGST